MEADLDANKGYLPVKNIKKGDVIRIHFDMPVRTVVANGKVADDKGKVAVERGPLVYCAEAVDNQNEPVLRAVMAKKPAFSVVDNYSIQNTETKGAPAFSVKAIKLMPDSGRWCQWRICQEQCVDSDSLLCLESSWSQSDERLVLSEFKCVG